MKKLVCEKDIEKLVNEGKKVCYVDENTLITPSAKDAARTAGIEISYGEEPCACCDAAPAAAAPAAPAAAQTADPAQPAPFGTAESAAPLSFGGAPSGLRAEPAAPTQAPAEVPVSPGAMSAADAPDLWTVPPILRNKAD